MEILITRTNNELYHYGVKGMKWGVVKDVAKTAYNIGSTGYKMMSKHGSNVYKKKAARYDERSNRASARGSKLKTKYYAYKSDKYQDRSHDDIKSFYEGIKDLSLKAESVALVASIGKSRINHILESRNKRRAEAEILESYKRSGYYGHF